MTQKSNTKNEDRITHTLTEKHSSIIRIGADVFSTTPEEFLNKRGLPEANEDAFGFLRHGFYCMEYKDLLSAHSAMTKLLGYFDYPEATTDFVTYVTSPQTSDGWEELTFQQIEARLMRKVERGELELKETA